MRFNFQLLSSCSWLLLVAACQIGGKESADKPGAADAPSTSAQHTTGEFQVSERLVAPMQAGGAWTRILKLSGPEISAWPVDKFDVHSKSWKRLGETNFEGEISDSSIAEESKYRVGATLIAGPYPAIADYVLDGANFTGQATPEIYAHRIVLSEGQQMQVGDAKLSLRASLIVIDGQLFGFAPSASGAGRDAGELFIRAGEVRGKGRIDLFGEAGTAGVTGAPGARGRDGIVGGEHFCAVTIVGGIDDTRRTYKEDRACRDRVQVQADAGGGAAGQPGGAGGKGGMGGVLRMRGHRLLFSSFSVSVAGGAGGVGGVGGAGGQPGTPGWTMVRIPNLLRLEGRPSTVGAPGPMGPQGAAGGEGHVEWLVLGEANRGVPAPREE